MSDGRKPARDGAAMVAAPSGGVVLGTLAAGSAPGRLLVIAPPRLTTPVVARATVRLDADEIARAVASERRVVLSFEDGDPARPIALGLLESETPLLDAILTPAAAGPGTPARGRGGRRARRATTSAEVDGRRFVLEGYEEVVLRCGDSSITLSSDGRVIIRGAYVETHAKGTNRIKGGAVKIN